MNRQRRQRTTSQARRHRDRGRRGHRPRGAHRLRLVRLVRPGIGARRGPITIGMSLPMTGPVADVSKSGYQGYELWASQVNADGGLLGRQVRLDMLDDGFDPNQTAADYTRLISQDHVDLLLGTFSSLLNAPASAVAARQGMLYVEPSGGAATLFTRGFTDLFFAQPGTTTSLPDQFVSWIASLPASQRPATAAYVTQDDPSASPAVAVFRSQAAGARRARPSTTRCTTRARRTSTPSPPPSPHTQPQMIIQGAVADDGAQFVRSLQKLGLQPEDPVPDQRADRRGVPERHRRRGQRRRRLHRPVVERDRHLPGQRGLRLGVHEEVRRAAHRGRRQLLHRGPGPRGGRQGRRQPRPEARSPPGCTRTRSAPSSARSSGTRPGDPEGSLLLSQWQQRHAADRRALASAATTKTVLVAKPAWGNG